MNIDAGSLPDYDRRPLWWEELPEIESAVPPLPLIIVKVGMRALRIAYNPTHVQVETGHVILNEFEAVSTTYAFFDAGHEYLRSLHDGVAWDLSILAEVARFALLDEDSDQDNDLNDTTNKETI
jgi:hypothetical protein